ncbi:MAG: ATP-dependent DNA helicase RecG [candidate division NC10 bacterium]|nr:ATP-dependent DNA helicase RecG [candidate division NC10 bacterium]
MALGDLKLPIQYVKGVGPRRAELFARLGVHTVEDALYLLPNRYEDRRHLKLIAHVRIGEQETIRGEVLAAGLKNTRKGPLFELVIGDSSGKLVAKWFNQAYLKKRFKRGQEVILWGKVLLGLGLEMVNPDYELLEPGDEQIHTGRIVPIYPLTQGFSPRLARSIMKTVVDTFVPQVRDFLPDTVRERHSLLSLPAAIEAIHSPDGHDDPEKARRRLAFDDFFLLSLGIALRRQETVEEAGIAFKVESSLADQALARFGYPLTPAQEKVLAQIKEDMARPRPMNRLLQGDVGSGKTIVAFLAMLIAVDNDYQAAIMAPTEILAEQHFIRAERLLAPLGVKVFLLTSSIKGKDRQVILDELQRGSPAVAVGTHALIQEEVQFARLGFVIIDEQHRFGVLQRARLRAKGYRPDVLVMTATPIPRTLALTVYGDLDISVLDEMPPGRQTVKTYRLKEADRPRLYQFMIEELKKGRHAYVICPLIEESEKEDLKAAIKTANDLQEGPFKDFQVGLLHGRMKFEEKEAVMGGFREGRIHLLVATTVVEVGVDVPTATVILIEQADRLGLSQLHQLRGRVGRAGDQAYCFLMTSPRLSEEAEERVQAMVNLSDGFAISEKDLEIRGPGDFFGTRQSGLPDLKVGSILRDVRILEQARTEAFHLVQEDPRLQAPEHSFLKEVLLERWRDGIGLGVIG